MTSALEITRALNGRWHGSYGTAPCPVCQPDRRKSQAALTLSDGSDGRLLAHCKKLGCAFRDILSAAGVAPGTYLPPDPIVMAQRERERQAEAERCSLQAKRLWDDADPITGSIAGRYLRGRGITCALPSTLRFLPRCKHPSGDTFPVLLALVEGSDGFGLHRTYLRADGSGKADVEPNKAMLGRIKGGAVRLTESGGPLVVSEGIETALSLASGLLNAPAAIWAALSTAHMRAVRLPWKPGRLTIASDGDRPGRDAATELARRAYAEGWRVFLLEAPDGKDWNDVLQAQAMEVAS